MKPLTAQKFRLLCCAFFLAQLVFSESAKAVEINSSYVGPNNGLYSEASNWSPNTVPNNGADTYNVFINDDLIVRLDIDPTISNLTLDSSFGRLFGTDHNLVVTGTTNLGSGNRLDVVSQLSAAVKFNLGTLADFDTATSSLDEGNYVVTAAPGTTSTLQFNGANIGVFDDSQFSNTDVLTLILTDGPISGTFANLASGDRLDVFLLNATEPSGSFLVDYSGNALTISGLSSRAGAFRARAGDRGRARSLLRVAQTKETHLVCCRHPASPRRSTRRPSRRFEGHFGTSAVQFVSRIESIHLL